MNMSKCFQWFSKQYAVYENKDQAAENKIKET